MSLGRRYETPVAAARPWWMRVSVMVIDAELTRRMLDRSVSSGIDRLAGRYGDAFASRSTARERASSIDQEQLVFMYTPRSIDLIISSIELDPGSRFRLAMRSIGGRFQLVARELLEEELVVGHILIEGVDEECVVVGRYHGQAPEVDGVTFIYSDGLEIGTVVKVRMTDAFEYDLAGEKVYRHL